MNWKVNVSSLLKDYELKHPPMIITVNKFNEDAAKEFSESMGLAHNTGQQIIPVLIDSYGGEVYSLMSMISSIRSSKLPVATIVQGKAMSCGAILFSFGKEGHRYMSPDATLMIHDVSSFSGGKVEEIKVGAEETERLNKKVYTMMARNCGHEDDYFSNIIHEKGHADWYLDGKEALKCGIANHLKVPMINVNINVDIEME